MNSHVDAFELAAAGLLHDVGKVLQPAGIQLFPDAGRLEPMICPVYQGHYSHKHVLFTAHVLDSATSNFGGLDRQRIERIAIHHHKPSAGRLDEHWLTKADWLASGHDRESTAEEEERTGLAPIVATLSWPDPGSLGQSIDRFVLPARVLDFQDRQSLPDRKPDRTEYRDRCRDLADCLLQGLNRDYADRVACIDGLLSLTQRLLHAIPASRYRGHVPDVSLFDHSRMVAAVGACLSRLPAPATIDTNQVRGRFRFVTLGVGGIQNFIFHSIPAMDSGNSLEDNSHTKGSAKRLRARSFFLSLYSWAAARQVLQVARLPGTNLIYDAGGHALVLLPDVEEDLQHVRWRLDEIARTIRDDLGGGLRFDYAVSDGLGDHHFRRDGFQHVLRALEAERANSRYRFPDSRQLGGGGWNNDGWVADRFPSLPIDRAPFLDSMRELGNALPKSKYLALGSGDRAAWHRDVLGERVSLHEKRPASGHVFALELKADDLTTPLFLSGSHLPVAEPEDIIRLTTARTEEDSEDPPDIGETLTFSHLARLSQDDDGRDVSHPMLGILKADVDLLGGLISYGFTNPQAACGADESTGNRATIGRLAALSRSIDQFFKGFVTEKIRDEYRQIYTVFVGGDDLFLIGPWYNIVRFTRDLHRWFTKLTCDNPNVTFSAGIAFTKSTIPVRRLAGLAEESLTAAKSDGRNRIGLGRVTLTWDQFHQALALHRRLVECSSASDANDARVNSSLIYRLLQYAKKGLRMGGANKAGMSTPPTFADMKWRAQMSYDLKRNLPLHGDEEDPRLIDLHRELLRIDPMSAVILYAAASLTLYFTRGNRT